MLFVLGGGFGLGVVDFIDAESDVGPWHFEAAVVFIEFKHALLSGIEFVSDDVGDFGFTEETVGFPAALACDEFVLGVEDDGGDGADEDDGGGDYLGVCHHLFVVTAGSVFAVDDDKVAGDVFDAFEAADFALGGRGEFGGGGHGKEGGTRIKPSCQRRVVWVG